ncbi:MAG: hypothetical protein LVQ97_04465 [Candidatus Micrarchaeales archaeon]|uniref:Uncharacterized protein n=1 Tax=Candidatus Micrarchaeum acidiphilum ARMAN-2 TaxID=425595 RepID=C7DH31_MICA2|nr:MAG: hypothetical protein UNLARM2_0377 [Candidatus Micrarchaeum acidiphilum ARMAN-2]MCW6161410.1 hypothetical protein [Candidatus Micrarchaeales archaeon]
MKWRRRLPPIEITSVESETDSYANICSDVASMLRDAIDSMALKACIERQDVAKMHASDTAFKMLVARLEEDNRASEDALSRIEPSRRSSEPYCEYAEILDHNMKIRNMLFSCPDALFLDAVTGIERDYGGFLRAVEDFNFLERYKGWIKEKIIKEVKEGWAGPENNE